MRKSTRNNSTIMYYTVLLLEKHSGKSQIVISNTICISVNVKNRENFYVKKVSGVYICKSVFYLWLCNLEGFLENIVPRERTSFPSYGSFINKTDRLLQHYPKSLPSSAENIRRESGRRCRNIRWKAQSGNQKTGMGLCLMNG